MRTLRPLLHVLIALLMMAQGIGVASASVSPMDHTRQGVMHIASAVPATQTCVCCGVACPDLLSCALSVIGLQAVVAWVVTTALALPTRSAGSSPPQAAPVSPSFRPPIRLPA